MYFYIRIIFLVDILIVLKQMGVHYCTFFVAYAYDLECPFLLDPNRNLYLFKFKLQIYIYVFIYLYFVNLFTLNNIFISCSVVCASTLSSLNRFQNHKKDINWWSNENTRTPSSDFNILKQWLLCIYRI